MPKTTTRETAAAALAAALLLLGGAAAKAASGLSPELQVQRVQLERSLEDRVKAALVPVTGTPDVVPVVDVTLIVEDVKAAKEDKGGHPGVEYVLPGVPVDQQLTKKDKAQVQTQELQRADRRVAATVFIGKTLDDRRLEEAKAVAAQVLEISPAAGDSLEFKTFEPAAAPTPAAVAQRMSLLAEAGIAAAGAFILLALAIIVFLFVFPGKRFGALLEAFAKSLSSSAALGGEAALPAAAAAGAASAGESPAAAALRASDEDALFGFINEDNLQGLVQALSRENEMLITSVLECLPRALAAQAFGLFSPEKRRDIVLHSRSVKYGNPEAIRNIEKQIRSKLGFSFGGVRKMARIVQRTGGTVRSQLIEDVSKVDPDLAKHLRDNLVEFEDVLRLDERSFGRVARELSIPSLARYLKGSPPEWVDLVAQKLNPELAALLKEQVSFTLAVTPEAVEEEFGRIVEIVERLKAAGLLSTKDAQQPARS